MFSYYAGLSRRRSSHSQNATSPPLPYASTINESPLASPNLLPAPASPSANKQISAASGALGSPFSVSHDPITASPNHVLDHQPSLPALTEDTRDSDVGNDESRGHERMTSGGSRAPLVARDFGMFGSESKVAPDSKGKINKNKYGRNKEDTTNGKAATSNSSESFMILPGDETSLPRSSMDASRPAQSSHHKRPNRQLDDPSLIPPPSVHDSYVSRYVEPLVPPLLPSGQSPETLRPGLNRSTSAPGHPHAPSLLPSAIPLPPAGGGGSAEREQDTNQPIFKIFDAQLSEDGANMSKKLRGYLEVVLKGQEEVGRMHLELEGLGLGEKGKNWYGTAGMKEEAAEKREKGVDEIMRRLDEISDTLRNYHQLGTPKLSFPRQTQPVPTPSTPSNAQREKTRTQSAVSPNEASPTDLARARTVAGPTSPDAHRNANNRPRAPTLVRSNTAVGQVSPPAAGKERITPRSPLVNTFRPPSRSSSEEGDRNHGMKKTNSDLPPEKLDDSIPFPDSSPEQTKVKPFFDPDYNKHSGQGWLEDVLDRRGHGEGAGAGKNERKITDSPVEMHHTHRW
ncbi:hypothetical protein IAU59_005644 [Kwoniella sp. CBS 9459]